MIFYDYGQRHFIWSGAISETRARIAVWRRFRAVTGVWPALSISSFLTRWVIAYGGLGSALWYGAILHNSFAWYLGSVIGILVPVFFWYFFEQMAWNRDLRRKGFASRTEVWSTDQFPAVRDGIASGVD